jgi:hypothetical protein|tara:strand:- start:4740 stop:5516 length:777 start_codon:yes stop_codon:yes gene_type:complete
MWLRLRQIALVTGDLKKVLAEFRDILAVEVCYRDPGIDYFGLENVLIPIGNQFLEIVAPIQEDTAGGRYLERRGGDGGYMVITQCNDHAPRRARVEELGIRVVYQFDVPGQFKNLQMHPKDTGGSFFEINEQLGESAHELDGPWHPAGGANWKAGQRLDRVSGIDCAEMQVDDPAAVAARWADIAQLKVSSDDQGNPILELDNAKVRFVTCTDGRPEGLGGLDLITSDREAIMQAAADRNCVSGDAQVNICGMRLNLI